MELLSRALAASLEVAKDDAGRRYLCRCAGLACPEPEGEWDRVYPQVQEALWKRRDGVGTVFTPPEVAGQLLDSLNYTGGTLLDPACGAGAFLIAAAERHTLPEAILEDIWGVELSLESASLARLALGVVALRRMGRVPDCLPRIQHADALEPGVCPRPRYFVGNPPYLEAKKRPPGMRETLLARFPQLTGAFDLYMAFLELALELSPEKIALVLPNKFLVARYAVNLRQRLLEGWGPKALHPLDGVFGSVGVYPIGVLLEKSARHPGSDRFSRTQAWWMDPPGNLEFLMGLLDKGPRLGDEVTLKSAVSFHGKGLRERYVGLETDAPSLPYLGGQSYARKKEVLPGQICWEGYHIHYAAEELRSQGNPLPPLTQFLRPKVIFCQHARSMVAAADTEGRFVTKDVYPIAFGPEPEGLECLFNSPLFSVLYRLVYGGIRVSRDYLHFLPSFLKHMPYTDCEGMRDPEEVFEAFGLSAKERSAVWAYARQNLDFDRPLERR